MALILLSSTASAAPLETTTATDGTAFVRQPVPPSPDDAAATFAHSRTIYMNREGGTVSPGVNDSRTQKSSIAKQPTQLDGWATTDDKWAQTVSCMHAMWSRFDVEVTDVDPGQTPHIEVMIGDSPLTLGLAANVAGIAPMALDCGIVEHSIVFVFSDVLSNNPQKICEVMSQEIGHSYGLDHELEAADPMTYLPFAQKRTFQDRTASCGETTARPCGIAGHVCRPNQNTVQLLSERLGRAGEDNTAPTVQITSPANRATVEPGFAVTVAASDNIGVEAMALYIDGTLVTMQSEGPFATDPALAPGDHTIRVEAFDANGNASEYVVVANIAADHEPGTIDPASIGCSTAKSSSLLVGLVLLLLCGRRRLSSSRA